MFQLSRQFCNIFKFPNSHFVVYSTMGYSRKKTKKGDWGHTFLKKPLEFFSFLLYLWKFQTKQSSTPGNSAKLCFIPWKFQAQKPRPLEIPHDFFLVTLGNSTSFLIKLWKVHMLFLWYPWKFHIFNLPCLVFFWNSPIWLTKLWYKPTFGLVCFQ